MLRGWWQSLRAVADGSRNPGGGVCDEMHKRKEPELLTAIGKRTVIDAVGKRQATDLG